MADDDEDKPERATARPPPGEEDVYSADTAVGDVSDEILAIIRSEAAKEAAEGAIPGAPGLPKDLEVEPSPDPKADSKAAEAIVTPVAEPVKTTDEPPNVEKGTLHPAVGIVLFFVAVVIVLAALIR